MYPSLWHPQDVYAAETARRWLAEAERARLARQLPPRASTWRVTLAALCRTLADRLDDRPLEHPRATTATVYRFRPRQMAVRRYSRTMAS